MPGFLEPSILYLSTWEAAERRYFQTLLHRGRARGYTTFVELGVGSFAMPLVARSAGFEPQQIHTSDVWLFSAVLGFLLSGQDLAALDLRVDGEPMPLAGDPLEDAVTILYEQMRLRMLLRSSAAYWQEINRNIAEDAGAHREEIRASLLYLCDQLAGLDFSPLSYLDHFAQVCGDPSTIVAFNPPTYKNAYERFFKTGGRLTWAEPTYAVWNGATDLPAFMDRAQDLPALVLAQQLTLPGKAAGFPVYARSAGGGKVTYLCCNRPDEVEELMGALAVPARRREAEPLPYPTIGPEDAIAEDAQVLVFEITTPQATYYRDLWLHKLDFKPAAIDVAIVVGGKLVAVTGYNTSPLVTPYPHAEHTDTLMLVYAVGPKHHRYRLTRLAARIGCLRWTANATLNPWLASRAERVITVALTKYPEQKLWRGTPFKMVARVPEKKYGYRLTGRADLQPGTPQEAFQSWLRDENTYLDQKPELPATSSSSSARASA
jgi:hypothetical protein